MIRMSPEVMVFDNLYCIYEELCIWVYPNQLPAAQSKSHCRKTRKNEVITLANHILHRQSGLFLLFSVFFITNQDSVNKICSDFFENNKNWTYTARPIKQHWRKSFHGYYSPHIGIVHSLSW